MPNLPDLIHAGVYAMLAHFCDPRDDIFGHRQEQERFVADIQRQHPARLAHTRRARRDADDPMPPLLGRTPLWQP